MTKTPWGPIGYLTYKRTYARTGPDGTVEEFEDTIERIIKACRDQLNVGFTQAEETKLRSHILSLRGIVAGRFLWQLGTETVGQLGMASLQNCAACVIDEPIRPFVWAMDMLMLGCGVGFSIQKEHIYQIRQKPKTVKITRVDTADADFIVPDSREGWCKLLGRVLKAHFYSGEDFSYSTHCVRGSGAPISKFGGTASGPEILCKGIEQINTILNTRAESGDKLQPIDALDVMNIIGSIVVAGNVRRSALLCIGDYDDIEYLQAKRWDIGNIPNWRSMSNNSVACNDFSKLPEEFWEGYKGNGEPYGLINIGLSRQIGRLGETQYPDKDVTCYNPCAEQSLANYETCCLAEVYLPNMTSIEELQEVTQYLYRINKHSLALACHNKETEEIVHANMRMGIGVTGYLQATEAQKSWLSTVYTSLREYDVKYSRQKEWPTSVKLTTVKPSGTLSLLAGVTPGVHPGYSQHFIRRVRMAADSSIAKTCRANKYPIEYVRNFDGSADHSTVVVEFPCSYPVGTVLASDVTALDQLQFVQRLQKEWSDNSVSCTVYYHSEELPAIREWLAANYNEGIKTVSFLLHNEHGFAQAPYEEITEEEYNARIMLVEPLVDFSVKEEDMELDECEGGACPVK